MSDSFFKIDLRVWPKVKVTFDGLPRSEDDYNQLITDLTDLYTRKQKFTLLFDTRNMNMPPLQYVKGLARWIKENRENAKMYLEKSAVLMVHPAVRVFLKTLITLSPPASPLKVCTTLRECVDYLGWLGNRKHGQH